MTVARMLVMPEMLGVVVAIMPQSVRVAGSLDYDGAVALLLEGPGIPEGSGDVTMKFKHEPGQVTATLARVGPQTATEVLEGRERVRGLR